MFRSAKQYKIHIQHICTISYVKGNSLGRRKMLQFGDTDLNKGLPPRMVNIYIVTLRSLKLLIKKKQQ